MRTRANQNEDAITLASNTEGLSSPGPRHQPIRGLSDPNMVLGGQEDSPRIRYDTFEELEPNDVIRPVEDGDDDGDDDRQVLYTQIGKSTRLNSSHLGISYAVFC